MQIEIQRVVDQFAVLPMRPVHGERGLSDARQAVQDDDAGAEPPFGGAGQPVERLPQVVVPDETGGRRRQQ